jgi:adenosylmethionine-8-amino-7-oxononanoate aminotransferase
MAQATGPEHVADYRERGLEHLWVHTSQFNDLAKEDGMLVIESGDGIYVQDNKGQR